MQHLSGQFRSTWVYRVATGALMLAAFLFAAWGSETIFDRLPRVEDEVTFLFQAQTVAGGYLLAPAPEHPEFFRMSFVIVRDGHWFGKYPPGFPALLAFGVALDRPWLVNAVAAALAVGLVAVIGRRLYDARTGLLAAVLLVTSPFVILQSSSLLSHAVSLVWALLLVLLFVLARERGSWRLGLAAGAVFGALFLTRSLTAAGIILPFIIFAAVDIFRDRRALARYLAMFTGALPFVVMLLLYNQVTTGSPLRTGYELWWSYDRIGFGPDVGRDGHDLGEALGDARANLDALSSLLFGWPWRLSFLPVLLAVIVALWRAIRLAIGRPVEGHQVLLHVTTYDLLLFGMAAGLVIAHMTYWTHGQMYGPRYYYEGIGFLALLGARGIFWLMDSARDLLRERPAVPPAIRQALPGVVLVLVVVLAGYSFARTLPQEVDRFQGWNGVTEGDLKLVEQAGLENAVVFVPRPGWAAYAPFFLENGPDLDAGVIYAVDRGDPANRMLMRDFPGRSYYRYADGRLVQIPAPSAGAYNLKHCRSSGWCERQVNQ